MTARTAQAISEQLAAAINSGEIREALDLWEKDAKLISPEGSEVRGREAIGGVLQNLVNNGAKVQIELRSLHQSGTTALATGTLTLQVHAPSGEPLVQSSDSLVIYRQGDDGFWRVAIDFPWGVPTG